MIVLGKVIKKETVKTIVIIGLIAALITIIFI